MAGAVRVAVTLEQCWHRVPGGVAHAAIESVRALLRRPQVELVGVAARHTHPPPSPWVPPIPVRSLHLPRAVLYESWHRLRRPGVERAVGPVDVIHATGMALPPHTAPMVVTVHDLAFLDEPEHSTRRGLRFFRRSVELARRDAELIVVPSATTRDECVRHGFDPERLRLVPWGVGTAVATDDEVTSVRVALDIPRPYVLWAGTIEPRKNLPSLLRAFARLDHPDLDLVLAGPTGWNEDLGTLIGALGERVRAVGFVGPSELRALYRGAEVFCFPSTREGFGLPVLEAMAQGTPVVTSLATATAEVAGDAGLLVDPLDPTVLAEALSEVLDDHGLAAALGKAGAERAATYSWDRTADGLAAVYTEVASA